MDFSINEQIFLFFNGGHSTFLDDFIGECTRPLPWVPFYCACGVWLWLKFGWRKCLFYLALIGIAVGLSDFICASIIRPYFKFMRPSNLDNPFSEYVAIVNGKRGGPYGFPSCHAANSFAVAVGAAYLAKNWFRVMLIAWALFICYTRMYVGVHYPADLLVGAIIGSLIASIMMSLRRLTRKIEWFDGSRPIPTRFQTELIPASVMLITPAIIAISAL